MTHVALAAKMLSTTHLTSETPSPRTCEKKLNRFLVCTPRPFHCLLHVKTQYVECVSLRVLICQRLPTMSLVTGCFAHCCYRLRCLARRLSCLFNSLLCCCLARRLSCLFNSLLCCPPRFCLRFRCRSATFGEISLNSTTNCRQRGVFIDHIVQWRCRPSQAIRHRANFICCGSHFIQHGLA